MTGSLFKCFRYALWRPRRRWRVARCRVSAVAAVACAKRHNYYALDAPKTDPAIRTEKERIAVGETLRANCTSGKSRPAPAVTWKLNGEVVSIASTSFSHPLNPPSPPPPPHRRLDVVVATWPYWMIRVAQRKTRCLRLSHSVSPRSITSILPFLSLTRGFSPRDRTNIGIPSRGIYTKESTRGTPWRFCRI